MNGARLKGEADRLERRMMKANAAPSVPIVEQHRKRLDAMLTTISNRAKVCRAMQKRIAGIMASIEGADWTIAKGDEQVPLEFLAVQRLAAATGARRVKRLSDGEIIRPRFLDRHYQGPGPRRDGYFFFSTSPRPGVYFFGSGAEDVTIEYEPEATK